jgi:hypothetical protein
MRYTHASHTDIFKLQSFALFLYATSCKSVRTVRSKSIKLLKQALKSLLVASRDRCKVNSDVFVRVSEETGVKILSSLA